MKNNVLERCKKIAACIFLMASLNLSNAQNSLIGMAGSGGNGPNSGVAFNYNLTSGSYNAGSFDGNTNGAKPHGSFIKATNGNIYGLVTYDSYGFFATGNGYLIQYNPNNNTIIPLFNFTGNTGNYPGGQPQGSLTEVSPNVFFGLTYYGGTNGQGVIFSYDLSSNTYSVHYNFNIGVNGYRPSGSLLKASNGLLYGFASIGGNNNNDGVLFSFNVATSTYSKVVEFSGTSGNFMGANPVGSLIEPTPGLLYGLTDIGGTSNEGTLFEYDINSNVYNVKHHFLSAANGGINPKGSLILAGNGKLYGLTSGGGATGDGTLFEYKTTGPGTYTSMFDFTGTSGANPGSFPQGSLIQGSNGNLFGMTFSGGTNNDGVIFEFDISAPTNTVLVNFSGSSGNYVGSHPIFGNLLEINSCLPNINLTVDNILCNGGVGSASVTASNNGPFTYSWSPVIGNSSTVTGLNQNTYTCAVTNTCGTTTQTFAIINPPALTLTAVASNPTICIGNSSMLTATASGGTGWINYAWVSGPFTNTNLVSPVSLTNYTVDIMDANGCTKSETVTVATNSFSLPVVNAVTNSSVICSGQSASLTASGALTYTWNNTSTNTVEIVAPNTTTTYTVEGSDINGCIGTATVTQSVISSPTVSAVSSLSLICPAQTVSLTASGATTYTWSTGSNNTVIAVSPTITTSYTISGTGGNGCVSSSVFTQSVSTCTGVFADKGIEDNNLNVYPNPFSNKIIISILNDERSNLQIFNALGSLIYSMNVNENKLEIDMTEQPKGIYFIRMGSITKKLIKE